MTFQQLLYVVEISKCGSINKAAQKLYISQTGMSSAVRILESELGICLFKRSSRGVEFTSEGKRFVSYAVSLLEQKKRIEQLYEGCLEADSPVTLSVSAQRLTFLLGAFTDIINSLQTHYYDFNYRESNIDGVIDDVYDHRADIGIITLAEHTEQFIMHLLKLRNMEFHEIAEVKARVYCRVGHPLTKLEAISEEDLKKYPYLYFERGLGSAVEFSEEAHLISLKKPEKTICVNNSMVCSFLLSETDAFTIGTGLSNKKMSKKIASLPLLNANSIRIGWCCIKNQPQSPQLQEYIALLEKYTQNAIQYTQKTQM